MDLKSVVRRIEQRLEALGLSASRASTLAGLSNSAIRNLQRSAKAGGKGAHTSTIEALAPILETTVTWLMTGREIPAGENTYEKDVVGLPVLGKINAGVWRDTNYDNDGEVRMLPVARDPRFPHARQYCLEVEGDSMDLSYPSGSFVTCVDLLECGLQLQENMDVHVERRTAGGQLVEITLKRVARIGKDRTLALAPHSSNPKHEVYPMPNYGDGESVAELKGSEILVRGVVIGKYQPVSWL